MSMVAVGTDVPPNPAEPPVPPAIELIRLINPGPDPKLYAGWSLRGPPAAVAAAAATERVGPVDARLLGGVPARTKPAPAPAPPTALAVANLSVPAPAPAAVAAAAAAACAESVA